MTGIDLSPDIVGREANRGCYDILTVGNAKLVILLPVAEDPPPSINAPCYADVKVDVVSVNFNVSGDINGNGRCGGGGGKEDIKRRKTTMTEEEKEGGGRIMISLMDQNRERRLEMYTRTLQAKTASKYGRCC